MIAQLDQLPFKQRVVVMDQCLGGNFGKRFLNDPKTLFVASGSKHEEVCCQEFSPQFFASDIQKQLADKLAKAERTSDIALRRNIYCNVAEIMFKEGLMARAAAVLDQAQGDADIYKYSDDYYATYLATIAGTYARIGLREKAESLFEKARIFIKANPIPLKENMMDDFRRVDFFTHLIIGLQVAGFPEKTRQATQDAFDFIDQKMPVSRAFYLNRMMSFMGFAKQDAPVEVFFKKAGALAIQTTSVVDRISALTEVMDMMRHFSFASYVKGLAMAKDVLEQAVLMGLQIGNPSERAKHLIALAELFQKKGFQIRSNEILDMINPHPNNTKKCGNYRE